MPVVEEIYKWHAAHEPYLRNERPLARVGMVYSQQTATYYGGDAAHTKVEDQAWGFINRSLKHVSPLRWSMIICWIPSTSISSALWSSQISPRYPLRSAGSLKSLCRAVAAW